MREVEDLKRRLSTYQKWTVEWSPLPSTIVKANFDASFHRIESRLGSRIVIRDEGVMFLRRSIYSQPGCSIFEAEILACWDAIKMGINLGFQRIIIEGDSLSVVKK